MKKEIRTIVYDEELLITGDLVFLRVLCLIWQRK